MTRLTSTDLIEANREKLLEWAAEGRSYFWMAQQIGINDRNAAAVSKWCIAQGIHRKAAK